MFSMRINCTHLIIWILVSGASGAEGRVAADLWL